MKYRLQVCVLINDSSSLECHSVGADMAYPCTSPGSHTFIR